ncbi:magnesium transporter [Candidatus Micrarchaeota archaeon]|nr:magnesium transporter [Candidatus Micrarchaeota archaeon]
MKNALSSQKIKQMAYEKDWERIKKILSNKSSQDIADIMKNIPSKDVAIVFRLLHPRQAARIFSEFSTRKKLNLLKNTSSKHTRILLSELSADDRTYLFEELPGEFTQRLLNLLSEDVRKETLDLLGYPEGSVGRLMTPDYIAVRSDWTISKALNHVRKHGKDAETVNVVFVVDGKWRLVDEIPLRRLIISNPRKKVKSVMDLRFVSINAEDKRENAVNLIKKYDLIALPVVDSKNVLLGIVTVDDVLDVLEDETTEDIYKGASVNPLFVQYSEASYLTLYKKRIIWLSLLAVTGFITTAIIAKFEQAIAAVVALAFFIPVLIGSGGNTGSQSATLIIRALATGDLSLRKWLDVLKKEIAVGIFLGATLGTILYLMGYFWRGGPEIGLIVGLSAVAIILWANLVGSLLPIILVKLKFDPAVVSSPLIATLVDITGLLIYFSIAEWWLQL